MRTIRTEYLTYTRGGSYKAYQVFLNELVDNQYQVNAIFGRIGALSQSTDKGIFTSYEEAEGVFENLVRAKTRKGYEAASDASDTTSSPVVAKDNSTVITDINLSLLTPVADEDHVLQLVKSGDYIAMEKYDGIRIALDLRDKSKELIAVNRTGKYRSISQKIVDEAKQLVDEGTVLDGELISDTRYVVFDMLLHAGSDIRKLSFQQRMKLLGMIGLDGPYLEVGQTYESIPETIELLERVHQENLEGIVLRHKDAPYVAGRGSPKSAKNWKYKVTAEADCLVIPGDNKQQKRSVAIGLLSDNGIVEVGRVSVPANKDIPSEGDIVSVRYLYAYRGGSLYQPFLVAIRTDKQKPDHIDSLRYTNR